MFFLEDSKLIPFDAVNLLEYVLPKEVIKIVKRLHKNKTNSADLSEIIQLFETCLNQDYLESTANHYIENSSDLIM